MKKAGHKRTLSTSDFKLEGIPFQDLPSPTKEEKFADKLGIVSAKTTEKVLEKSRGDEREKQVIIDYLDEDFNTDNKIQPELFKFGKKKRNHSMGNKVFLEEMFGFSSKHSENYFEDICTTPEQFLQEQQNEEQKRENSQSNLNISRRIDTIQETRSSKETEKNLDSNKKLPNILKLFENSLKRIPEIRKRDGNSIFKKKSKDDEKILTSHQATEIPSKKLKGNKDRYSISKEIGNLEFKNNFGKQNPTLKNPETTKANTLSQFLSAFNESTRKRQNNPHGKEFFATEKASLKSSFVDPSKNKSLFFSTLERDKEFEIESSQEKSKNIKKKSRILTEFDEFQSNYQSGKIKERSHSINDRNFDSSVKSSREESNWINRIKEFFGEVESIKMRMNMLETCNYKLANQISFLLQEKNNLWRNNIEQQTQIRNVSEMVKNNEKSIEAIKSQNMRFEKKLQKENFPSKLKNNKFRIFDSGHEVQNSHKNIFSTNSIPEDLSLVSKYLNKKRQNEAEINKRKINGLEGCKEIHFLRH